MAVSVASSGSALSRELGIWSALRTLPLLSSKFDINFQV